VGHITRPGTMGAVQGLLDEKAQQPGRQSPARQMTPSFTRAEYWLLEAAVRECLPIAGLSDGDAAGQVNKADHGVTREVLVRSLDRLFTDGLIIGEEWRSPWSKHRRKIRLGRLEIERELSRQSFSEDGIVDGYGPKAVYYWLTPKGGAAWEAFAHPDWDIFLDGFAGYEMAEHGPEHGDATCPSKLRLELYLAGVRWLGYEIDRNAIVWRIIRPWKATYWKKLPMAHRVRFPIIRRTEMDWAQMPHDYRELNRWYCWGS